MRLPNLRRSRETEYQPLQSQPLPHASKALEKWEHKLTAEERLSPATPTASADIAQHDHLWTERGIEDRAADIVKKNRTDAQIGAMAALYASNPAVFAHN